MKVIAMKKLRKIGPKESKDNDDGGPSGAIYKKIWNRIFHREEECSFYFSSMCILKVKESEEFPLKREEVTLRYACEGVCSRFKKGTNIEEELRNLKWRVAIEKNPKRKS